MTEPWLRRFWHAHPFLGLILALGLLHGLLYVFIIPPWQHYDEPGRFEYAWLLANRPGLPQENDHDPAMRREMAASMIERNFFRGMGFQSNLIAQSEPVWIGLSQVTDPPLYYGLVALPLRLARTSDIAFQLYLGRLVSLLFYLASLAAAYGLTADLTAPGHPLRWMVPGSLALLPGYTDLMTAVNNDVAAIMFFSFFLWGGVRLIRHGFSVWRLLWLASAALLCYWTKNTVFLALPLLLLALLLALFQKRWRWVPWLALAALLPFVLFSVFSWGDALFWVRGPEAAQKNPTRVSSADAPLGEYALSLDIAPNEAPAAVVQLLPADQAQALRGKTVTLGAWVWASRPIVANPFSLDGAQKDASFQPIQIGTAPVFHAFSATITENAKFVRVNLSADAQGGTEAITVFYDGLVLAEGAYSQDQAPQFDDFSAGQGTWGGKSFENLLRNASGESGGPGLQPWVEKTIPESILRSSPAPSWALNSILDWQWSGRYYQEAAGYLLSTFWAKFGWGHIPILPFTDQFYFFLGILTLAGLGGMIAGLVRRGLAQPWALFLFLALAATGIWGQTFLRGIQALAVGEIYIPPARYAYPAIIPSLLVLNAGWLEIACFLQRWAHLSPRAKYWAYGLFFLVLDVASLSTVIHYYYIR
ncbi:MAG: hypothetical protein CVU44_06935 [Chloroflexi bacterium HGW-Chloroflexi-6]|nr:MAG: hypothetical protein CVU44_06935 [Chloroflexi bacterium HGW-Chloroflexi-6]